VLDKENFKAKMMQYELHKCKKKYRKGQLAEFYEILSGFHLRPARVPKHPAVDHLFKFYAKALGKEGTLADCVALRKFAITEALQAEDLMKSMGFRNVVEDYCRFVCMYACIYIFIQCRRFRVCAMNSLGFCNVVEDYCRLVCMYTCVYFH
jgi:hypothetical protein